MHTKTDAMHHIETALGDYAAEHDIDTIADQIWDENGGTWDFSGFDTERFWEIAQTHARTEA